MKTDTFRAFLGIILDIQLHEGLERAYLLHGTAPEEFRTGRPPVPDISGNTMVNEWGYFFEDLTNSWDVFRSHIQGIINIILK